MTDNLDTLVGLLSELYETITAINEGVGSADGDSIADIFTILDKVRGRTEEESFLEPNKVIKVNPETREVLPNTALEVPNQLSLKELKDLVSRNAEALDDRLPISSVEIVHELDQLIIQQMLKAPVEDLIQEALPKACSDNIKAALQALDAEAEALPEHDAVDYLRENLAALRDALVVPHSNQDGERLVLTFVDDQNWQELKNFMSEPQRLIANQIDAELAEGEKAGTVVGNITPDGQLVRSGRAK